MTIGELMGLLLPLDPTKPVVVILTDIKDEDRPLEITDVREDDSAIILEVT